MRQLITMSAMTLALLGARAQGAVVYVNGTTVLGGDGSSWPEAFGLLQQAIAVADDGDEIWVAAGTYVPDYEGFAVADSVSLYGGFAGWETQRDQRDWAANETTLSGDTNNDDGPGGTNREDNSAHVLTISGEPVVIDGFVISGGTQVGKGTSPDTVGAGIKVNVGAAIVVRHCRVSDNTGSWLGGGLFAVHAVSIVISDTVFVSNSAVGSGGAIWCEDVDDVSLERCVFRANRAFAAGAASLTVINDTVVVRDCLFASNGASEFGGSSGIVGGLAVAAGGVESATLTNCVFSRNSASQVASALLFQVDGEVTNCTFSQNTGAPAISLITNASTAIRNSIVWGNSGTIAAAGAGAEVGSSCIEGGWPGSGNIDADPLLVQPGTDNVRLAFGSPCMDAGDNGALPHGVTTDLAGAPRIQGGVVDMGAYEGEFEPLPQAVQVDDLDQGEAVILVPSGGSALDSAWAFVHNVSGDDNAIFAVAEPEDAHAGAGGYAEASSVLAISTTLIDGTHFTRVLIPFSEGDLAGAAPLDMNATYYAPTTGTWAIAVSRNTSNSPGHPRAIGDRIVTEGAGTPQATDQLGDYGVHWNASTSTGIVWANVDHASEFGAGVASCVEDCAQPPDERTGFLDLVAVLRSWGAGDGPFDADGNGAVGAGDIVAVVVAWGLCQP